MGRKTFDSLPGLLPGRRHIVLTRDARWSAPGAEVATSVEGLLALVADAPVVSVIGGAEVYRLFEPIAHRIELTEVHLAPEGDVRIPLPDADAGWRETVRDAQPAVGDVPAYDYVTYIRP